MTISDQPLYIMTVLLTCFGLLTLLFILLNRFTSSLMYDAKKNKELELKHITIKKVDSAYIVTKRCFDLVFSLLAVICLMTLFPFIALAIKLDSPGPIFYRQKRIGLNNKIFYVYKFRTVDIAKLDIENKFVRLSDNRLTRIGYLLRKTGLDELTVLFSIVKGDMSFIGRSKAIELIEADKVYGELYNIKPGLISLWTISEDRINSNSDDVLYYDLLYASIRSFLFDLLVLVRAVALGIGFIGDFRYKK